MSASAVSSLGAEFVEPPDEGRGIRQGLADIVAAVAQAGGEVVHVLDDAGHALRSTERTTSSTLVARVSSFSASGPTFSAACPIWARKLSMPSAFSPSACENFSMFWTVRLMARLVVGDDPAHPLHHVVGAAGDIAGGSRSGPGNRTGRRRSSAGAGPGPATSGGGARLAAGERDLPRRRSGPDIRGARGCRRGSAYCRRPG